MCHSNCVAVPQYNSPSQDNPITQSSNLEVSLVQDDEDQQSGFEIGFQPVTAPIAIDFDQAKSCTK